MPIDAIIQKNDYSQSQTSNLQLKRDQSDIESRHPDDYEVSSLSSQEDSKNPQDEKNEKDHKNSDENSKDINQNDAFEAPSSENRKENERKEIEISNKYIKRNDQV